MFWHPSPPPCDVTLSKTGPATLLFPLKLNKNQLFTSKDFVRASPVMLQCNCAKHSRCWNREGKLDVVDDSWISTRGANRWRQRNRTELTRTRESAWFCSISCRPYPIFFASVRVRFCCRQHPKFRLTCASRSQNLIPLCFAIRARECLPLPNFYLSSRITLVSAWFCSSCPIFLGSRAFDSVNCPTFVVSPILRLVLFRCCQLFVAYVCQIFHLARTSRSSVSFCSISLSAPVQIFFALVRVRFSWEGKFFSHLLNRVIQLFSNKYLFLSNKLIVRLIE
jgi:hypothetical protein